MFVLLILHRACSLFSCSTDATNTGLSSLGVPGGDFGRSVNPISTRGTDYAHLITTGTPVFSDLPTALLREDLEEI